MKITDKVSHSAKTAYHKVADATNQTTEALGKKGEKLKKTEKQLLKNGRGYISDNPVASVSIAIATGFLMSLLFSRA